MVAAALNKIIVLLKLDSFYKIEKAASFCEGKYVFYRNGIYYFMWSVNDTRSPTYSEAYAMSDFTLGKFTIPANNLVIAKDTAASIYETGRNSVL